MGTVTCPGCGLVHPDRHLPPVPERAMTGECAADAAPVRAAFYEPDLAPLRQYVVDALAAQHPSTVSRRAVQTTALCLMTMDLYFECGQPVNEGSRMHQEMMRTHPAVFVALDPPDLTGSLTHRHVSSEPREQYASRAKEWARSVWETWAPHHAQIRAWNEQLVPSRARRETW
jgi:hypothetical protein